MSEENVELVRRGMVAFLNGDTETALATASPDLVAVRMPPLPDSQTYHGAEGLLQMWADWTAPFDRFEMTVGEITETGGRVVAEVTQRATGQSSGAEVEGRFWFVYTLEDGLIVRLDAFGSERQALEAIGRMA